MTTAMKVKVWNGSSFQTLLDICYPVGSIYQSTKATSPATLFGGTWRQLKDRFLLGAGSKSAGAVGGEENHKLTVAEMPSHTHQAYSRNWWVAIGSGTNCGANYNEEIGSWGVQPTGGGQATTTCRRTSPCTCGSAPLNRGGAMSRAA